MRILNAIDAISPAFSRTRLVLFAPFRWGRTWKLSATAYLSFAGVAFVPFSLLYMAAAPILNEKVSHAAAVAVVVASIAFTALYTFVFVLCSRLQFAFFDIVLNRGEFVAPAWRKYGAVSKPWTLLKLVAGVALTAVLVWPCLAWVHVMTAMLLTLPQQIKDVQPQQGMPPQMFSFMAAFYGSYFVMAAVLSLYYLVFSTLSSFMVPSMALEGMTQREAFGRFTTFVRKETGAFFGFVGLRIAMAVAGYMGLSIALELVLLVLFAVVGGLALLFGLLLHSVGVPSGVLTALGIILGILFVMAVCWYGMVLVMGAYFTFFEAHTLYFLGGRYPMLGKLLEGSTPLPAAGQYPGGAFAPPYSAAAQSPETPAPATPDQRGSQE
jgi:hypothetical protein